MTTLDELFAQHGKLPDPTPEEQAKWQAEFERKQAELAAMPDEPESDDEFDDDEDDDEDDEE